MPAPYWNIRLARPDDIEAVVDLVRVVHGDRYPEVNRASWNWRYLGTGEFRADILMAEHEGQPVGVQPVSLFDYQWGSERLRGAMYTGVLTHPDHRRRGIFRSLVSAANEHATRRGAQFSMALPNEASFPGFIRSGDWCEPGLIPLYAKACHGWVLPFLFRGRSGTSDAGRMDLVRVSSVPDELDDVSDAFARDSGGLMVRRTAAYWNWRYGAKPSSAYHTYLVRQGGRVEGAVVTSAARRMGLSIGMIMDVVARGGPAVLGVLLREAVADAKRRGCRFAVCQATHPLRQALREEGFRYAPAALVRKRFHLVFRTTGVAGLPRLPDRLTDWHITFGDSDNA